MNEIVKLVNEVADGSEKQSCARSVRKDRTKSKKSVTFAETSKNAPEVVSNVVNTAVPIRNVKVEQHDVPIVSVNDNQPNSKTTENSNTVVDKTVANKASVLGKRTNMQA